ncbi:DUF5682 family protein [Polaromonas sp.]|uniref:DUF5682 family protein n=1 Tax=Polaromonas sp. TaxID=1869339 RepID=UPI003262FD26
MSDSPVHYFGIRHHGPGCARSLGRALEALQPDCVLVEGPPDADALLPFVLQAGLRPPVALLVHGADDSERAAFYPFAEFSPEWQALRFGLAAGLPTRFIDLPQAIRFAQDKLADEADKDDVGPSESAPPEGESPDTGASGARLPDLQHYDPMDALAEAAGFSDGESWWNHLVEERGDSEDLFVAIAEAMTAIRAEWPTAMRGERHALREEQREAHMRQCVREAIKAGHTRIAVVCGAWHVPALRTEHTAKADAALLKGLPKAKVNATWVPWTYRHLTSASGYGAGIDSPGWYDFLWRGGQGSAGRAGGWLARVARLLRDNSLDCSSAHVIEATRLADTLSALRGRAAPGLVELDEAVCSVMCLGDPAALLLIRRELTVGDRMGEVPPEVPAVPLQRDIDQTQKSLRLKPEALQKTLELDLRQPNDLARSRMLHRLSLLDIGWGALARGSRQGRGTFRETWQLQWQPEFALRIIEASRFGSTLEQAAGARVVEWCAGISRLDELAGLVDSVLLADLGDSVRLLSEALQARAAITGDALQLIAAVPPLANVFRYGSVRQTDSGLLAQVLDGLIARGAIGLPLACQALDETAAQALRDPLLAANEAIGLRESAEQTEVWRLALRQIASGDAPHALLRGLCCRLLLDAAASSTDEIATWLSRALSAGVDPLDAALWLDGFLNRNAMVLLHDTTLWRLIDDWLTGLSDAHFLQVVPLVRRSFAAFSNAERRDLGQRAARGSAAAPAVEAVAGLDAARAAKPLPTLRLLLGLPA